LLPDVTSSDRWESKDHPLLVEQITAAIPGVHIDYTNAQDNSANQLAQAETDLANGDCILVVAPHDSIAAAAIVTKAKAQNVPVIAYDRLIQSKDTSYYVSFDGVAVGALQGQYIAANYRQFTPGNTANIAVISGSQTDTNALLFSKGLHEALDPLFANGSLKNVYEIFTPDWSNPTAQTELEEALSQTGNDIQIAYVANDGMADAVISALRASHLNGKVLVTGQDATVAGIHNILTNDQSMTVYKPIVKEAQSVGALLKLLYSGGDPNSLIKGATSPTFDGGNIPSVLDAPIAVSTHNIANTVIADNYVTRNDVCTGVAPGTDNVC
jgi:D-xylose transport system substrate-binding protein